ncbi:VCBS repeat-containing protein [Emticicia sp. TH156]|uniref:VCBS repeat-containing protein n=1 Tax=Emticicia sp. TH156 TaxID=2067454 RepID=UPI000C78F213|nr:VCBS repeat-containing protein [Emticicia sp. TH156]PLK44069.1 RNA-binding protein [Emticicia sp. TH156]
MKQTLLFLLLLLFISGCKKKTARLFDKLAVTETGVDFVNSLKPNDTLNAFNFTNFYNGGGVGIGDFNNDGLMDVFLTGNQVSSELYLNKGNLKFEKITKQAGLSTNRWCNGVSIIDINNDGWDDIYLSVAYHPSMADTHNLLFINQKTSAPTFKEAAAAYGLDYAGYTTQTAFLDYDGDGDLDAFLLNTSPDTQNPSYLRPAINDGSHPSASRLFKNDGASDGHPVFRDVSAEAGIIYEGLGLGVVVSDYNNDGRPDIYCSNDFLSSDALYLNKGNRQFENVIKAAMPHTALSGMGIDAADINQDGKVDIFQLDMLPEDNARQKQMLGKPDYDKKEMSIHAPYNYELQYMRNMLQVNVGNAGGIPQFSENGLLAGVAKTDWSWSTLLCDLDNDGRKDIFITNGYRKNVTDLDFISYYRNKDMFGSNKSRVENRKKLMEMVPEIPLKNYAYRNRNNLDFENVSESWGLDELSYANGAAYADLDNDGDLDLIVNNVDSEASVFRNNSDKQNGSLTINLKGDASNKAGIGARINAWIGNEVLLFENYPVRGYLSSMPRNIVVGLGKKKKIDSLVITWPDGKVQKKYGIDSTTTTITLKYEDATNGKPSPMPAEKFFETIDDAPDFEHRDFTFIDFNQTATLHKMLSKPGPAVAKADINGDGLEDLAIGGALYGSETQVFVQNKDGKFSRIQEIPTSRLMEVGAIHFFDADNDGDQDLIFAGGSCERPLDVAEAYRPQLWLNNGRGNFKNTADFPLLHLSSRTITTLDIDNDHDLDIFIGGRVSPNQYPVAPPSYILRNDKGKFTDATAQVAPYLSKLGMVCDAAAIDINQDGYTDLVVVGEWMPLTTLINKQGMFTLTQKAGTEGWWNTIATTDLNHDGLIDLVMGNEGLNSFYKATSQHPIVLLAKDFDNNGRIDPVMGQYVNNQLVPVHPRDNLNLQINSFRKRYTNFKDYSGVLFDDLFSETDKKGAIEKQAYELRSCLGINTGKGGFSLTPLPWQAQQSPVFSILSEDFNQDGHQDILLAGNFFANEAHQGRQDASRGALLLGNGKGGFQPVDFDQSGLNFQGDTRQCVFFKKTGVLQVFANAGKVQSYQLQKKVHP